LDSIPKIGNERKKKILKYLNELSLNELSIDDLVEIDGIGKKLASEIINKIQQIEANDGK